MGKPGLVRVVSLGPGLYPQLMPVDCRQGSALPATQIFACANMTECNADCGEPGCAAVPDAREWVGFVLCLQLARHERVFFGEINATKYLAFFQNQSNGAGRSSFTPTNAS